MPPLKAKFPNIYSYQKTAITFHLPSKSLKSATSMQCITTQTNKNLTSSQLKTYYSFLCSHVVEFFSFCFSLYMSRRPTEETRMWKKAGYRKIFLFPKHSCSYRFKFHCFLRHVSHLLISKMFVAEGSWLQGYGPFSSASTAAVALQKECKVLPQIAIL